MHVPSQSASQAANSGSSIGLIVAYPVLAAAVIVAFMHLAFCGQGLAELDPSQMIGP